MNAMHAAASASIASQIPEERSSPQAAGTNNGDLSLCAGCTEAPSSTPSASLTSTPSASPTSEYCIDNADVDFSFCKGDCEAQGWDTLIRCYTTGFGLANGDDCYLNWYCGDCKDDYLALLSLYTSTNGGGWTNSAQNWFSSDCACDCENCLVDTPSGGQQQTYSTWAGVYCDDYGGRVTGLNCELFIIASTTKFLPS